jgi:hypothetical protein
MHYEKRPARYIVVWPPGSLAEWNKHWARSRINMKQPETHTPGTTLPYRYYYDHPTKGRVYL